MLPCAAASRAGPCSTCGFDCFEPVCCQTYILQNVDRGLGSSLFVRCLSMGIPRLCIFPHGVTCMGSWECQHVSAKACMHMLQLLQLLLQLLPGCCSLDLPWLVIRLTVSPNVPFSVHNVKQRPLLMGCRVEMIPGHLPQC